MKVQDLGDFLLIMGLIQHIYISVAFFFRIGIFLVAESVKKAKFIKYEVAFYEMALL